MSIKFCKIAKHFNFLEILAFGFLMTHSRNYIFRSNERFKEVLMVGEGTGRFTKEFLCHYPHSKIVILEPSEKMRVKIRNSVDTTRYNVEVLDSKMEDFKSTINFDLICTCFFWDCFSTKQIHDLEKNLRHLCQFTNMWYNVDFYESPKICDLRTLYNFTILRFLYFFFQKFVFLKNSKINSVHNLFCKNELSLVKERVLPFPPIKSQLFKKACQ